jgi:hypothetical protein
MRISTIIRWVLLATIPTCIVSCGSLDGQGTGARFHEGAAANLVLIYYGPASVYMTKPDTRENGFLPLKTRDDVLQDINRPDIGRDLAVVVVGYMSDPEGLERLMQGWEAELAGRGYQRVVFLRSGLNDHIDGLLVLRDSVIANSHVQQAQAGTGISVASIASAP